MKTLFNEIQSDAMFTTNKLHRIWLNRIWDESKDLIMFIGLNPSTANADTDDATIRRLKSISMNLGFGGFYMMNLFTFISTDPKKLNKEDGNIYRPNDYLLEVAEKCEMIVFAWGNFEVMGRDKEVKNLFSDRDTFALHINKNGSPKHPLYPATKEECRLLLNRLLFDNKVNP